MTTSLENLLPSQETTDGTVTNDPSVCVRTKKKKSKSDKRNEFKEGFEQGSHQQSIKGVTNGILMGCLLCLFFSVVCFLALSSVRKQNDLSRNVPDKNTSKCHKRVIGYYNGRRNITEEHIEKLTHIIFNGIRMENLGEITLGSDEQRQMFKNMKKKARKMKSDVKLMFATDAYRGNQDIVASVMAKLKFRKTWTHSIASFLLEERLDGVEIVYRFPKTSNDKKNFASFVRELKDKLEEVEKRTKRNVPYIISIYSNPYHWTNEDVPLLDDILNDVNFFNVETDNFYAPLHKGNVMTGPLSPLYSLGNDKKSIDCTMKAYTCKTMKPSKLNVILTFRGSHWRNVSKNAAQSDDLHFNVEGTKYSGGDYGWRNLKDLGWKVNKASWHNVARTPYIWHSDNRSFLTFENERSLEEKMEYILSKNLGGVTVDQIDQDDDSNTLLNAVTSMDMCSGSKFRKEEVKYNCGRP